MTQAAKRKAARRRKAANRVAATKTHQPATRPERLVQQAVQRLHDYVMSSEDAEQETQRATNRIRMAVRAIVDAAAPFDVFDVLESIRQSNMLANPETYSEAEHEGSAAVIELTALVLAARGHRNPPGVALTPRPRADAIIGEINNYAHDALTAGGMRNAFLVACEPDPLDRIGLGTVLREVSLRNAVYPHMMTDTLHGLFDEPTVQAHCQTVLGCSVSDILAAFDAFDVLHTAAWQARFTPFTDYLNRGRMLYRSPETLPAAEKERGRELVMGLWADPGDCSVFTTAQVAAEAGVAEATVDLVRDLFSTDMTVADPADVALDFLGGVSSLRTRPLLRDPAGSSVLVHSALVLPAVRERVEEALKASAPAWVAYSKHRGDYLEEQSLMLLAAMLPGATVHPGFEYFFPDPDAVPAQTTPASFTRYGETDGLLLIDDMAIIVEAKAVALREASRTGDQLRLRQDLKRIVGEAADQAQRLRTRIETDGGLRLRDGSWLDLSGVREIHSVAVSLDDLSGVTTVTTELVQAGLLNGDQLPWTVSVHDLRIISELVARPAELIMYLRRRTEPDVTRKFHAVDELDLFLHMYATGLWVEPDPDAVHAELPQLGEPSVASRRRFRQQRLNLLTSRTGPLDEWYLHQQGVRRTSAPRPSMKADAALLALVDEVAARAEPGWLSAGSTLLEGAVKVQRQFAGTGANMVALTLKDGKGHDSSLLFGSRRDNTWLLTWMSARPDEPLEKSLNRLREYSSAKKHQLQFARAAGLLYDSATGKLVGTTYDNRVPGVDRALDAAGAALRPVGHGQGSMPPPVKRKR